MSEGPAFYKINPATTTESRTAELVALAHANRQGVPYEDSERLLAQLPERLRSLADLVLGGKMRTEEIAYALAVLVDSIEHAPDAQHDTAPS